MRCLLLLFVATGMVGCQSRMFVDLGNGTGVPAESIQKYAQEHGISRQEARARMRAESDATRSNAEIDAMPMPASHD